MHWDDLRYFLAVARGKTLTAAAGSLHVDATTVGRRIDRLSASINSDLFEATPSGYVLTDHGERFLQTAEEVERSILGIGESVKGERSRLRGSVRLSLSEGFATSLVSRQLSTFHKIHPEIELEIVTTNGFLNPSKREADLAVMLARPVTGALVAKKLTDYSLSLYASTEYLDRNSAPATPGELNRHTLIGYIPDFIYAEELRYLSEIHTNLKPTFSSSSINAQLAMTQSGAGICVLPDFMGKADKALTCVMDSVKIRRTFWLVIHRDLVKVARVRAVMTWLDELVQTSLFNVL